MGGFLYNLAWDQEGRQQKHNTPKLPLRSPGWIKKETPIGVSLP